MKRRSAVFASTAALALTLAACGGGTSDPTSPEGDTGSASGPQLVIYSNSVSDGRGEFMIELAEEEGFNLQYVSMGGGDIQNRLLAEKNNPIADVVFGLNNVYFENLKADGVLEAYTPSWSGEVDAEMGDGEGGQFWPIVREPIMLIYNTDAYPDGAGAPADWPDLWENPEYHGLYETPTSLGGATTQMVLSGILTRYTDSGGNLGVSDEGWEAIDQFFQNGSPAVEGEALHARMANGSVTMGQMWLAGKFTRDEEYGITTEPVYPEGGVPMVVQHVALVNGTDNAEEAQRFIDWFGSAEVQAAWSNEFFTAPTNESALATANQDAVSATDAFTAQEIDWAFVAENLASWIEEIELNYLTN